MNGKDFARHRQRLMRDMDELGIAIVPTAPVRQRNRDIEYPFRPDSDFFYLTGYEEPEAVAVLAPGRPQGEYVLFCRERDAAMEQWHGRRSGLEGACERYRPGLQEGPSCVALWHSIPANVIANPAVLSSALAPP